MQILFNIILQLNGGTKLKLLMNPTVSDTHDFFVLFFV